MKLKKVKIFIVLIFLFVALAGFYGNSLMNVNAVEPTDSLHTQTKIYSSNNDDYFNGCEDYADYVNSAPTITVLTHGLGMSAVGWSNDYNANTGKDFVYNSNSLINKMYERLNGQMTLYLAIGKEDDETGVYDYKLTKYSYADYINSNGGKVTSVIDDVSKHIVIVPSLCYKDESNYTVYNEFHYILDNISAQYKNLTGVLPRFNLVSHSRGGITNIMYATEHPYNVASVFSMGSPYSGSVLGELEICLKMMGYTHDDYQIKSEGVKSIMNETEMQGIRDAWNRAYTADVNMNVVAYGSMASIHLLKTMMQDMNTNYAKYEKDYGEILNDYGDLLDSVISVIEACPGLTSTTLNFVNGLAKVFNMFGVDLFDILFTKIDSNLKGKITYEEVRDVLGLVNVINNEVVIMDDIFIDLNSQLGYGFEDGISYNGFKRYIKIFGAADYTDNRAIADQPGIVHNLEIMNETYTNDITNSLVFGVPVSAVVDLSDEFNDSYSFNLGKAFSFAPEYTGTRKFTANSCAIKLYRYDENNCVQPIETAESVLTYKYEKNKKYLMIAIAGTPNNIGVSFKLEDKLFYGNNNIEIGAADERVYKLTVSASGYYVISVSDENVLLSGASYNVEGSYIYLSENTPEFIYLTNTANHSVNVNIEVHEPSEIQLNEEMQITGSNQKIFKFTNSPDSSFAYKLDASWGSGVKDVYLFDAAKNTIGSKNTNGTNISVSFILSAGQTCYIIYSDTDSSITSKLYVNREQLRWRIDGEICETVDIQLPKGASYTVELIILGDTTVYYTGSFITTASEYFSLSNNVLSIADNALIGYDITIYPELAPDYLLTIQIGYNSKYFSWSVANGDNVVLTWNVNNTFNEVSFTISNSNGAFTLSKATTQLNMMQYLPKSSGNTTIRLKSVKINNIIFNNGTKFLNVGNLTVNNLFAGGSGTSSSPYTIACYRHLNNIRESSSSFYKLINDINLSGYTWKPIKSLRGTIDGNSRTISNMKISVEETSDSDYRTYFGFVEFVNGTIKNLKFSNVKIQTNVSSPSLRFHIGAVAGGCGVDGTIYNCDVTGSSAYNLQITNADVGGIVGVNTGYVYDSDNYDSQMNVSGYAGGIVGANYGRVEYSYATRVAINYYWNTDNGRVGGIVGYNAGNGTITNCFSSGTFYWKSTSNSRDILPSLGYVVGYNEGSYSNCGTNMTNNIEYYYWHFIGRYDQSDRCFKVDEGKVGYQP